MIDLEGEGVLALWNGVEAARTQDYNLWHTREHVPERVAVPGMLGARRYVRTQGPLPEYLTLYALETVGVLLSDPYKRLLENPSSWSRAMRPSLRDFFRLPCRRKMSTGGGLGSFGAACVLTEGEAQSAHLRTQLPLLARKQGIVAVHLFERDYAVPDVPFQVGGAKPSWRSGGAIVLEGYDEAELAACEPGVRTALRDMGLAAAEQTLTSYRLAYAIDRTSIERVVPIAGPVR